MGGINEYFCFPLVEDLSSITEERVFQRLDGIFVTYGVPSVLKTDNDPPFSSRELREFLNHLNVKHQKSTPLWPQTNGIVECFMSTIKKNIQRATSEKPDLKSTLYTVLRTYWSTPHSMAGESPASLMFRRAMMAK